MQEPIPDYEQLYSIDETGTVYSKRTNLPLRWFSTGGGYQTVALYKDKKRKAFQVHQLVAKVFIPNTENKPHVHHKDHLKFNNHKDNLEWVTPEENARYRGEAGRYATGENSPLCKVSDEMVTYIRSSPNKPMSLARELDLPLGTVESIKYNKSRVGGKFVTSC